MKYLLSFFCLITVSSAIAQQQETFDIATYTIPKGWKKNNSSTSVVSYATINEQKGTYCQVAIYASTASKGSLQADFEKEWEELVVKPLKPTSKPELIPAAAEKGWETQGGIAPFSFEGTAAAAMLVTASNKTQCMSLLILTNSEDYQTDIEKFVESFDLKATTITTTTTSQPAANNGAGESIRGTWTMTSSDQSSYRVNNGIVSHITRQYTLNDNGTYTFISKLFDPMMDKLLLGRETGTYQINGNNLTITPQKSVLEAWSKKNGTDKWGNLLNSQDIALEKVTYQFTKHYFSGIQEWNLVLQASAPTKREGPFSSNDTFKNAYYYCPISSYRPVIELPGNQAATQQTSKNSGTTNNNTTSTTTTTTAVKSGFAFTSTNFDDGWTSTVQEDWVQVEKGSIKVLVHYPTSKIDVSSADYETIANNAWNTLVAPRYSGLANFFVFRGTLDYERPYFICGDVTDQSGKRVYVALFKRGKSGWLEFITADKNSFVQAFGIDISKVDYYAASEIWEPLWRMADRNKFAVGAADLKGKWINNFSGMTQYVNVYTGMSAGATGHSSTEYFLFTGSGYHWDLVAANGVIGSQQFNGAKSDGTFSVPNNWQINFSNIEGKPKTYNAFFSCIKGARVLWLEDTRYPGYTGYGKQE